jgi:hypothetical protein
LRAYRVNLDNLPDMMGKIVVWVKMGSMMMIPIVRKRGPAALCITVDLERERIFWITTF